MNDLAHQSAAESAAPLLRVDGLRTHIGLRRGTVKAVDGVTLHLHAGETLGIVGESGSGKSMTSLSILRLLPKEGGKIVGGQVLLEGTDLVPLSDREMAERIRGRQISMISQDPMTSLNPLFTIADQVGAPLRYHKVTRGRRETRARVVELLRRVRIPSPETRLDHFPHQFSGGMRQRVVAAMAIACSPKVLIADEPTSNLDVTIQVQMMQLFRDLQRETGMGIIMITHDMGVAAGVCDRIAVMYAGRVVETADVRTLYKNPRHPYTQALLNSIPHLGQKRKRLYALGGQPPSLIDPPKGCRFAARCPKKMPKCEQEYPPERELSPGHTMACWLAEEEP